MLLNKLSQGQRRQSADGFHQTVGAGKDPVLVVDGDLGEVLPEEVSKLLPINESCSFIDLFIAGL